MAQAIDFYFDFSSPYGYFMSERIDALAERHGRKVRWRPVLLGVVYQTIGSVPTPSIPLKGPYVLHDIERSARFLGIPYRAPAAFPVATQAAARAYYWLHERDCPLARRFAHAIYRAYFVDGRDISAPGEVLAVASELGADRDALAEALGGEALKARLRDECQAAIARGVFGSPTVFIDDEAFWGVDRLPQIERWLADGRF